MSTISNSPSAIHHFLLGGLGDGAIGFDGMGPIDYKESELEVVVLRVISRLMDLEEARVLPGAQKPKIVLRRGVKEFDLAYDYRRNVLLISEVIFLEFGKILYPSLSKIDLVVCHFGSRVRNYYFANLKNYFCWREAIDWRNSTFKRVDTMRFDINRTDVERGGVPIDHEVSYDATCQKFDDADAYIEELKRLVLHKLIPERLALRVDPQSEIINLSSGETIMKRRIVSFLRNRVRPKSKVPGMCFSHPLIPVHFERAK